MASPEAKPTSATDYAALSVPLGVAAFALAKLVSKEKVDAWVRVASQPEVV